MMDEDPIITALRDNGERNPFQPVPAEERSGADRLRPPYATPIPGGQPATAGASVNAEVGFHRLPPAYQQALLQSPLMQTLIGVMPPGFNVQGQTNKTRGSIVADTPQTMAHELVHEIFRRLNPQVPAMMHGNRVNSGIEEALARQVGGNPPQPGQGWAQDKAADLNTGFQEKYDPRALGLLQMLMRMISAPGRLQ